MNILNDTLKMVTLDQLDQRSDVSQLFLRWNRNPKNNSDETVDAALASAMSLGALVDDLAAVGHGLILAIGEGGVGKTTIAAAIATALADRGLPVHLSTTNPAAHIAAMISGDQVPNMTVD